MTKLNGTHVSTGSQHQKRSQFDFAFVRRFIGTLLVDGPIEIRVPKAQYSGDRIVKGEKYHGTFSGFFDNESDAVRELCRLRGVSAYVVTNPVFPAKMAGDYRNKLMRVGTGKTTDAKNVVAYFRCLIDFDAIKDSDISATDDELDRALSVRDQVLSDYPEIRAASFWGCSGNGGFAVVNLGQMANDDRSRRMVERFLKCLNRKYAHRKADGKIDTKTSDPSRLMCIPGTVKCKGANLPDRPHRTVTLDSPADHVPVPFNLAGWLAIHDAEPESENPGLGAGVASGLRGGRATQEGSGGGRSPLGYTVDDYTLDERIDRARSYLAKIPGAIEGQEAEGAKDGKTGSKQTFHAAFVAGEDFALSIDEAWKLLKSYNNKCVPPWTDTDLWHKLTNAYEKKDGNPPGYRLLQRPPRRHTRLGGRPVKLSGGDGADSEDSIDWDSIDWDGDTSHFPAGKPQTFYWDDGDEMFGSDGRNYGPVDAFQIKSKRPMDRIWKAA